MTEFEFQIENFMLYCTSKNLARKTLASYEQSLKLFAAYLRDKFDITDPARVQSGHIRQYIKYLRERGKYTVVVDEARKACNHPDRRSDYNKPVSATTIGNYVRNIKVFFNYLYEVETAIPKNPCEKIENIKPERKVKKMLTADEIRRVVKQFDTATFHGYRNLMITKLLLDTGMRVGECLSLTPAQFDFHHKSILIVNPKNKQQRYVYFSHRLSRELKQWMKFRDRYSSSEFMFPTTRGTQLEVRNYEKALRDAGARAGVDIHPHQLRNNFAKYYIMNGGDWFTLSRILGHSSVEVTQKAYLDFTDEEVGQKYQRHSPIEYLRL